MDIVYLGNSCFKLKGKEATVVTDPYDKVSADIITLSTDSNAFKLVSGTPRRPDPYLINAPGEYEVNGVGVFGWGNFKEVHEGSNATKNTIYSIIIDGVRIVHTGAMKQVLSDNMAEDLGTVDVLLVGVNEGAEWGSKEAAQVVEKLSPSIVVPMHYEETSIIEFLKLMGAGELIPQDKLKVSKDSLPEGTQTILMSRG
jgi:L-ascorbate metabolism protein UlaG (beta-lactamase superfamily)